MKRWVLFMPFIIIFVLSGCKEKEVYLPMFQIEDTLYCVTNEPIDENEIEKEIGMINEEVKDIPAKDGEGYRIKKGTVIYKIKGESIKEDLSKEQYGFVAFLDDDGQYRGARKYFFEEEVQRFFKSKE